MEYYFKRYGDLELQRRMVSDRPRSEAFARAIREAVRDGDVVLDVGTGTGILAMLAAKAGASKVYGLDQADIVKTAANLVKANGLGDRVTILRGPAAELSLDDKADLLVSEWLGHVAFVEGMLEDVLAARDRNLAEGGRMMPSRVRVLLAPLDDPILYGTEGPGFWRDDVFGLDFSSLEEAELRQGRTVQIRVEPAALLAPGRTLVDLDLTSAAPEDAWTEGTVRFTAGRDGVHNGFAAWFEADLSPSVSLDTGPHSPETHWSQTYLSFQPMMVRKGDPIEARWSLRPDDEEPRYVSMSLGVGDWEQTYLIE